MSSSLLGSELRKLGPTTAILAERERLEREPDLNVVAPDAALLASHREIHRLLEIVQTAFVYFHSDPLAFRNRVEVNSKEIAKAVTEGRRFVR